MIDIKDIALFIALVNDKEQGELMFYKNGDIGVKMFKNFIYGNYLIKNEDKYLFSNTISSHHKLIKSDFNNNFIEILKKEDYQYLITDKDILKAFLFYRKNISKEKYLAGKVLKINKFIFDKIEKTKSFMESFDSINDFNIWVGLDKDKNVLYREEINFYDMIPEVTYGIFNFKHEVIK